MMVGSEVVMELTPRFDAALAYASEAHRSQCRKSKQVPYVAHVLGVASIALEFGATEDEAIGALLHDVAEDCGGEPRLADVKLRFGEAVAAIVRGCSDSLLTDPHARKSPWRPRKEEYVASIAKKSASIRLVSCADKVHNATDILRDCRIHGTATTFQAFSGGLDGTLWYYRSLVTAFRETQTVPALVDELDRLVTQMEAVVRGG
jgi:GTP pyrophosphokinase